MVPVLNESQEAARNEADAYFGVCPVCKKHDGCLDVGRNHWFRCDEHKTRWWFGSNAFPGWREQTEDEKAANIELLEDYADVEPYHPEPSEAPELPPPSSHVAEDYDNGDFPF